MPDHDCPAHYRLHIVFSSTGPHLRGRFAFATGGKCMVSFLTKIFGSRNERLLSRYRKTVARINGLEKEYE